MSYCLQTVMIRKTIYLAKPSAVPSLTQGAPEQCVVIYVWMSRPLDQPHSPLTHKVLFSPPLSKCGNDKDECLKIANKLHKQFAHPAAQRLKKLIQESGVDNPTVLDMIDDVSASCDTCKRYKRTPSSPVTGFPLANAFNETVAMDLKFFQDGILLHMIDHATRYSQACIIPDKKKGTIVRAILKHWISIFGTPGKFLTDNGGEFINDEVMELAEQFNITLLTTAAESPWSNDSIMTYSLIWSTKPWMTQSMTLI